MMWNPQPGEVYAAYQWWDTFESWNDHFPIWRDVLGLPKTDDCKGPSRFRLFADPSRRSSLRRAYFEFGEERNHPFWVRRIRVEVDAGRVELAERVLRGVTASFSISQKQQVVMLAAAEHCQCDVLPHSAGIEVPPHPQSYEVELMTEDTGLAEYIAENTATFEDAPSQVSDWLLIRVYLDIVKLREVR
jgi:hypothetical protein